MQFKKLHLSTVRFICYFICFTVFLWNGWPKCLQEPNIYDVHLTWRMRNIDHAVVLSWIKRKIYSSTYIKVHAKWNIRLQFIFYFNLLGAVFWIILEKQFLCPKKVAFLVFLYRCYLTILVFEPLKRSYILQDYFTIQTWGSRVIIY